MVTGCAPFFLLCLVGVALGSWFFGSHSAARFTGLALLTLFVLYFALLNWTAQTHLQSRRKEETRGTEPLALGGSRAGGGEEMPLREEDRTEWFNYLRTEGRILWATVVFLLLALFFLAAKS